MYQIKLFIDDEKQYKKNDHILGKELNKLLRFRSNPIVVFLYVLYM